MWPGFYRDHRSDQYISATAPASTASGFIGPCPEGFCWFVERVSCYASTSSTTSLLLELYVQSTDKAPSDNSKQGRQDVAVGAVVQNGVSDESSPIYVGPGQFLVALWSGVTQGDLLSLSTQIRVHELVATVARGGHPSSWTGVEDENGKLGHPVVVGDQVAEV